MMLSNIDVILRQKDKNRSDIFRNYEKGGGVLGVLGTLDVGERDEVMSEDISSAEPRIQKIKVKVKCSSFYNICIFSTYRVIFSPSLKSIPPFKL